MAKKQRLGLLWIRENLTDDDAFTPADLDLLWQRAYSDAIATGQGEAEAKRIADAVVRELKARDNEAPNG